jgi:hypothetical protein
VGVYQPSEEIALAWIDSRISRASVWVGIDERLRDVNVDRSITASGNVRDISVPERETHHFLISEAERARAIRIGIPLPQTEYEDRLYDNGYAQFYRLRPQTPYQR